MFRKIAIFSVALFLLSVLSVYAQGGPGGQRQTPEEMMKAAIKTLTEKLTLTPEQVKKITDLYTKNNEERAKMRESMMQGGDRQAMMEAFQKNRTELNKKIDTLLDEKQKEAFAKYLKEEAAKRPNMQRPPQQ